MPRYTSQVNHNGLPFGAVVDIPDEEVENWAGEIEAGFLVPVYEPPELMDNWTTADVSAHGGTHPVDPQDLIAFVNEVGAETPEPEPDA